MTTDQIIEYTNKSCGIHTELKLVCADGEINYSSLMHHLHEVEKLVGYCGEFSLVMKSREGE